MTNQGSDFPTDADIDAVLAEFEGDARRVIRALPHDLAVLAADYKASVSHGYVRGDLSKVSSSR